MNVIFPIELYYTILEFLSLHDLIQLARVNKFFYQLINDPYLWRRKLQKLEINYRLVKHYLPLQQLYYHLQPVLMIFNPYLLDELNIIIPELKKYIIVRLIEQDSNHRLRKYIKWKPCIILFTFHSYQSEEYYAGCVYNGNIITELLVYGKYNIKPMIITAINQWVEEKLPKMQQMTIKKIYTLNRNSYLL